LPGLDHSQNQSGSAKGFNFKTPWSFKFKLIAAKRCVSGELLGFNIFIVVWVLHISVLLPRLYPHKSMFKVFGL
jgi:hypothetical protein